MALNRFIGWSLEELEAEIRSTQEQLDKMLARVSAGDTDVSFQLNQRGLESRLEQLYAAARVFDADKYPVATTVRVDRTRATFSARFNNGNPTL